MARRRRAPAVSLFAFQDIITSVSGILIVMVLLLTLELVEQADSSASPRRDAARLRDATAQAENELRALQTATAAADRLLHTAAQMSPLELQAEISALERRIAQLKAENDELQQQAGALASAEKQVEAERFDARAKVAELERLRRRIRELEEELTEAQRDQRPIFTLPRGVAREGWLVVVESDAVRAARLGVAEPPRRFSGRTVGPLSVESSADSFLAWSAGQATGARYYLVLVRPQGVAHFKSIEAVFRRREQPFGFDLIGPDQVVLHPDRGAAP